jgi:MFS family permease
LCIVFGPVIARSLILRTAAGWRWSYYLGVIVSVIALALYQFFYYPPTYKQLHVQGKTKLEQLANLDYGGMFLFTSGMVLVLIGLSWGGTTYDWDSPQVLCALVIGIASLLAFGLYGRSGSTIFSLQQEC